MTYVLCELLSKRHDYFCAILGPVAQWIRHLTTNQGIPGSSPGRIGSFDLPKMRPQQNVTVPRRIVRSPRPMEIRHKCILHWLKIPLFLRSKQMDRVTVHWYHVNCISTKSWLDQDSNLDNLEHQNDTGQVNKMNFCKNIGDFFATS